MLPTLRHDRRFYDILGEQVRQFVKTGAQPENCRIRPDAHNEFFIMSYSPAMQYAREWPELLTYCRGSVFDAKGRVMAMPFRKFWNKGEMMSEAATQSRVQAATQKEDGSLIIAWHDPINRCWRVNSRGSFLSEQGEIARKLFERIPVARLDKNETYLFELVGPSNRIVLPYAEDELILIGVTTPSAMRTFVLTELSGTAFALGLKGPRIYMPGDIDTYMAQEGVEGLVCVTESGHLFKMKTRWYLEQHYTRFNFNVNTALESFLAGDLAELIGTLPDDLKPWATDLLNRFTEVQDRLLNSAQHLYKEWVERAVPGTPRVQYAKFVKQECDSDLHALLFALYDNKDLSKPLAKAVERYLEKHPLTNTPPTL